MNTSPKSVGWSSSLIAMTLVLACSGQVTRPKTDAALDRPGIRDARAQPPPPAARPEAGATRASSEKRQAVEVGKLTRRGLGATDVAISPDLAWVATSYYSDTLFIWSLAAFRVVNVIPGFDRWQDGYLSVAFAPGQRLITSEPRAVRIWQWDPVKLEETFADVSDTDSQLTASGDQLRFAYAGQMDLLIVRDSLSGRLLGSFVAPGGCRVRPALDGTGRRVACLCGDGTIRVWDVERGRLIGERRTGSGDERSGAVQITREGREVVYQSGAGRDISVWDLVTGNVRTVVGPGPVKVMALHPAGRFLAVAMDSRERNEFFVVDLRTGSPFVPFADHSNGVCCLAFSVDGRFLMSGSDYVGDTWVWRFVEDPAHPLLKDLGQNAHGTRRLYNVGPGTPDE